MLKEFFTAEAQSFRRENAEIFFCLSRRHLGDSAVKVFLSINYLKIINFAGKSARNYCEYFICSAEK